MGPAATRRGHGWGWDESRVEGYGEMTCKGCLSIWGFSCQFMKVSGRMRGWFLCGNAIRAARGSGENAFIPCIVALLCATGRPLSSLGQAILVCLDV